MKTQDQRFSKERIWADRFGRLTILVDRMNCVLCSVWLVTPGLMFLAERLLNDLQLREMFRIDWWDDRWYPDGDCLSRRGEVIRGTAWGLDR